MNKQIKPRGQQGATLPRVRAISRAVSILRAFSEAQPHLALNEIVRATGLDAGTTRRILVTLRDEGLIRQDPATGRYSTSSGLLDLARSVPDSLTVTSLVEDRLIQLAEDTQTTVYLSIVQEDEALCTARHNGGLAIEVRWWAVGETRPFHRGTGPRVLLAHLEDEKRARLLEKLDDSNGTLAAEVESIRKNGFIVKHDEIAIGLSAMAVPLLDENGRVLAGISTGGLTPRYVGAAQAEMLQHMLSAVQEMQQRVRGYRL
ncbi:IclR family transcriptional regulator [Aestuariivita boseongensis]|uniref:IclR family transcriptional regulator n=1 Tax=Aestuariivita boseongensis TaxID=1470562 RepID=UPI00068020E5|nr:IclR family transcriptional regulator [Aestuariivita boseongensis]